MAVARCSLHTANAHFHIATETKMRAREGGDGGGEEEEEGSSAAHHHMIFHL